MSSAMSAIGTKRTFESAPTMSAFGGKADIIQKSLRIENLVRKV